MRNDLDHLPADRQTELQHIVRILFEEFEDTIARTTDPKRKKGRILKVILYGSFARGDWVDDPVGGYKSDYDILVVVNDERLTDFEYWAPAEDRLMREATITKTLSAPVGLIVHSLADVNSQLKKGLPFFRDVAEQGSMLYEAEGFPISSPGKLSPEEKFVQAQKFFVEWSRKSCSAMRGAARYIDDGELNDAAFTYHQAVERLYHCLLLTLMLYSPKSHKLSFLRGRSENVAAVLSMVWPGNDRFSRRCFELLRQAYVNARYSPNYVITIYELSWISERVDVLKKLVFQICEQHLTDLSKILPGKSQMTDARSSD